ncbi:hypothetical protein D6829_00375 [Candidatus Pacearchaeota archaeon]|nr:MAG: hypothetical protein D6829_00375 [Candidatus Pacearchaeota archaeon]
MRKTKAFFEILILIASTFAFSQMLSIGISNVSAQDALDRGCCEVDNHGNFCTYVERGLCKGSFVPKKCSVADFCQAGCCYNQGTGSFRDGVLKRECKRNGWKWGEGSCASVPGSELGCCIIGRSTSFTTRGKCEREAEQQKLSFKWDRDMDEAQCKMYVLNQSFGACVIERKNKKTCKMLTAAECSKISNSASFHKGLLCTASSIGLCKPTRETSCFENFDEVYFVDSCGNRANVYDSSKADDPNYWERIISPKKSCNFNDPNGNADSKTCGNCNRIKGGICASAKKDGFKPDMGDYYCKKTYCKFEGKIRRNQESWCYYETKTGMGRDPVGSRHFIYRCTDGVVVLEPCQDFRYKICLENKSVIDLGGGKSAKISTAKCINNLATQCFGYNKDETKIDKCKDNAYCMLKNVDIGSHFKFSICLPKVPIGYNINSKEIKKVAGVCNAASVTCKVVRAKKKIFGGCKPVKNAGCLEKEFAEKMNEICTSLGDCGAYVNYNGDYSDDGYSVKNSPKLGTNYIENLKKLIVPDGKDPISAGEISSYFSTIYGIKKPRELGILKRIEKLGPLGGLFSLGVGVGTGLFLGITVLNPLGAVLAGVSVFIHTIFSLAKKCKPIEVKFECRPWQPPSGGDKCNLCNKDKLPCTKYRCESLGAACRFFESSDGNDVCLQTNPTDVVPPRIYVGNAPEGLSYEDLSDTGFKIKEDGGCIRLQNTQRKISLKFKTDEPAICRASEKRTNFDNMSNNLDIQYSLNHSMEFVLTNIPEYKTGLEAKDVNFFLGCKDVNGAKTSRDYVVSMCVDIGPDVLPPAIEKVLPKESSLVSFDSEQINVTLFVDEPSECKWRFEGESKQFDEMNEMNCATNISDRDSLNYWECTGGVPIENRSVSVEVLCKDQPWLSGENDSKRNVGEIRKLSWKKPDKKISIDSIKPSGEIVVKSPYANVDIEVDVSGGSEKYDCSYKIDSYSMVPLEESDGSYVAKGLTLYARIHNLRIRCKDRETGDVAEKEQEFEISRDTSVPEISRVWTSGSTINFKTTEYAECRYSEGSCKSWGSGEDAGKGTLHKIPSKKGDTYYIRCVDALGNEAGDCLLSVRAI